jgi:hypothetical protein
MYYGPLSDDQIAAGRLAALKNAEDIMADAMILHRRRRWARTYVLSQIAVESAGKYFYLFGATISVIEGAVKWPRFWKAVRSHSDKTTLPNTCWTRRPPAIILSGRCERWPLGAQVKRHMSVLDPRTT